MRVTKESAKTVSLGGVAAFLTSLATIWGFAAPIAQRAMAGEIKEQIAPIVDAFQILLIKDITSQKDAITAMEFKERSAPASWTLDDEKKLREAKERLQATEAALKRMTEKSK